MQLHNGKLVAHANLDSEKKKIHLYEFINMKSGQIVFGN